MSLPLNHLTHLNHLDHLNQQIQELIEWCDTNPTRTRENLLVFKTWMRLGNHQPIPYLQATIEECMEWIKDK